MRIGPSGRAALYLLAVCPRMPTNVVGVLLGHRQAVTTAQLLARLRRAGLAHDQVCRLGPLLGSRPVRLWTLTDAGRAALERRGLLLVGEGTRWLPYGEPDRWHDAARQRSIPLLIACYRLLAEVVSSLIQPVRVCGWEHPWARTIRPTGGRHKRRVRLPAAVVLHGGESDGGQRLRLLLLPDIGTAPLSSHRLALQALIDLRRMTPIKEEDEPVLVVGVAPSPYSTARVQAWRSLLQQVGRRADERPLRARVLAPESWLTSSGGSDGRRPQRLAGQVDEVFALVARHPLLTRQQLAVLLRTSTWRIAALEAKLIERGWLREVTGNDTPRGARACTRDEIQHLGLVEITTAGGKEAARRLLVPAGLARRQHGVMSGDASMRRFLRHVQHTFGANAVFVAFASAARRMTERGGDEALEDWRSAAACARGRFRPDGYGCYRREGARFGFFVEFDRGTEKPREYATKLESYFRYRDSSAAKRGYAGFPTLLVVTTSPTAEARFACQAYLAEQRHGGAPLSIFLTTTSHIEACPEGVLGPIWRSATDPWATEPARICWLPRPRRQFGEPPAVAVVIAAKWPRRIYDANSLPGGRPRCCCTND